MLILFFQSGKAQTSQLWQTSKRMMQHMQQVATAKPDIRVLPKPVQQNSTISSSVIRNLMTGTTLYLAITINLSA
jgi:hypothetical protein